MNDDDEEDLLPIERGKKLVKQEERSGYITLSNIFSAFVPRRESAEEAFQKNLKLVAAIDSDFVIENEHCKCQICFDYFEPQHVIQCSAERNHFVCLSCFSQQTSNCTTLAELLCVCKAQYGDAVLRLAVSPEQMKRLETKQSEIDEQIALENGVERVLYCKCGYIGVVEKASAGDQTVRCNCNEVYCLKCGNYAHPGNLCPPPSTTLRALSKDWIQKHTKKCPGCGFAIEKNEGCRHMTCTRCKYNFCWQCLEKMLPPYTQCNCNKK